MSARSRAGETFGTPAEIVIGVCWTRTRSSTQESITMSLCDPGSLVRTGVTVLVATSADRGKG